MTLTHADLDEFAFLPEQADDQGRLAPAAERVFLDLPDGRTLSAIRYGDGACRTVLVHGAGLNAHTWDRTAIALGEPCVAIDLAGHGESSWRDDAAYAPALLADDVIAGIEAWAQGPVVLVGHSLGGLTSAAVAAARPDLVASLALVDIVPGASPEGAAGLKAFYERVEFDSVDDVLDHAMSFRLGGRREQAARGVLLNTRTRPDGVVEWKHHMAHLFRAADGEDPLRHAQGAQKTTPESRAAAAWADLERVACPILLVRGTRGFITDADVAGLLAHVPGARSVDLDAPHNVQEAAFLDLADLIRGLSSAA